MDPESAGEGLQASLSAAWRELAAVIVGLAGLAAVASWASVRWHLARHVERPPRCPHCGKQLALAPRCYEKRG